MKLREAIAKVRKTPENESSPHVDDFCREVGLNTIDYDWDKLHARFKGYYLIMWYCTDQSVGLSVYFIDDKPVAIGFKPARKSDEEYEFIDEDSVDLTRAFLLEMDTSADERPKVVYVDLDQEINPTSKVSFADQIVSDTAIWQGETVRIIRPSWRDSKCWTWDTKEIEVETKDGIRKDVPLEELEFPLLVDNY